MLHKAFPQLSQTGMHFLYLKANGECDCVKGDTIFDKEPDPFCKNCYGSGYKRSSFITPKLRFNFTSNGGNSKIELQSFELIKEEFLTIYFPQNYNKISYTDIIAMIKTDINCQIIKPIQPTIYFKIVSIDDFIDGDFKYYSVKLKSINFIGGLNNDNKSEESI